MMWKPAMMAADDQLPDNKLLKDSNIPVMSN